MNNPTDLIPSPPVIREQLARNIKERRFLRSLLRLSTRMVEEFREAQRLPRPDRDGKGVIR